MFVKYAKELIIVGLLVLIIAGIFIHFSVYFEYLPNTVTLDGWVKTASYFNNVLSPILLTISITLIYLTWATSRREFQDTKHLLTAQNSDLKAQIKEQEFKNEFDIFSNRMRSLASRINIPVNDQIKSFAYMSLITHLDEFDYKSKVGSWIPEVEKIDSIEEIAKYIQKFIMDYQVDLASSIYAYLLVGGRSLDMKVQVDTYCKNMEIIDICCGFQYLNSKPGKIWLRTFLRHLKLVFANQSERYSEHSIDEMLFNLDSDLVTQLIIELAKDDLTEDEIKYFTDTIKHKGIQ
ncbi:hypothetical protein A3733_24520 [Pseudoalteromonas shioyasakiensis]|nr:hypothetical protein A3733_24520 [Pseudoalteromonas shioyasakiensis]